MPYLTLADGLPLYYEQHGSGPNVLLVPGWTITTRFWERQINDLANDCCVTTLDLRGAGNSGKTPDRHSLAAYGDDIAYVIKQLDLEEVTLVAWAMAVSVVVRLLAYEGCSRVQRFVWVDHSPAFFDAPDWDYALLGDLTPTSLDGILHSLRHDRIAATRALITETMFASTLSDSEVEWMVAEALKTPTEVAVQMLAAVANADLRPLLPRLRLPVLVINGNEIAVPPDVGGWLEANLPNARAVRLEGAGHAPFWDAPAAFNSAVREFIALGR